MNTNIICHVLIHNKSGSFLITRRSQDESVLSGYWDIPGGSLEGRESPLACTHREASEEVGLDIQDPHLAYHTSNIDEEKEERFVRLIFLADTEEVKEVTLSKEHDKFEWVSPKSALANHELVDYLEHCFDSIQNKSHNLCQLVTSD